MVKKEPETEFFRHRKQFNMKRQYRFIWIDFSNFPLSVNIIKMPHGDENYYLSQNVHISLLHWREIEQAKILKKPTIVKAFYCVFILGKTLKNYRNTASI